MTANRFADDLDKLNKRYRNSSSWINPKTVARAAEIFESTPLALDSIQFAAVQVPAKEIIVNQHEQYNFVLAFFVGIIGLTVGCFFSVLREIISFGDAR